MSVPTCPIHGKAMRAGKKPGTYFCATKISSDPDVWCTERVEASTAKSTSGGVQATHTNDSALACAALQFAGALCHGLGPDGLTDALACAAKAYELGVHLGGK